ncbi:MAG: energy transducer TonB [Campylobacterales bacterium]|nr:energy transducer TonB [Campylobacterales bacterium]
MIGHETKALVFSLVVHFLLLCTYLFYFYEQKKVPHEPIFIPLNLLAYQPPAPLQPMVEAKEVIESKSEPKPEPKKIEKVLPTKKHVEQVVQMKAQKPVEEAIKPIEKEIIEEVITPSSIKEEKVDKQKMIVEQQEKFIQTNFSLIRDMALANLIYPNTARRMGWSGIVEVRLVIDTDGKLLEAIVVKSSGRELLDTTALESVLSLKDKVLPKPQSVSTIILPIAFSLK